MSEDIKFEEKNNKEINNKETGDKNKKDVVSVSTLKENGVYFGHKKRQWNPKMSKYVQFVKNDVHIISADTTQKHLSYAYAVANKIAKNGGKFLFVGTKNEAKKTVKENAERVEAFYINERWLGGTLTNFRTVKKSVNRLKELENLEKTNFDGYTKKEGIKLGRDLDKLSKLLTGIKSMRTLPDAIVVASTYNESTAIQEASKLGIPVFAIVDTNSNPDDISFVIPANDDASKSVSLIITVLADAIASAKGLPTKVAFKNDNEIEIMGIIEKPRNTEKPFNSKVSRPTRESIKRDLSNLDEKETVNK
ncbi:MAG: 30S ribosomal protein S2, partial [Mycoplasmataceae bacterium]|nr:30S ribosomal protein S2 [Mycoplasmataceae bacterium]